MRIDMGNSKVKEADSAMEHEKKYRGSASGSLAGAFWFAGWLFTISFAELVWWKILLGIVVWPLFLGNVVG